MVFEVFHSHYFILDILFMSSLSSSSFSLMSSF